MRRAAGVIAGFTLLLTAFASPAEADTTDPSSLASIGTAQQVITVIAESQNSTTAVLQAFERNPEGGWRVVLAGTRAHLGWKGLVEGARRRQGTGTTPAGTYAITRAFGRQANPGTSLRYLHVDRDDSWLYSPKSPGTYNTLQTVAHRWKGLGDNIERLRTYGEQYDYAAVLGFNLPTGPFVTRADGVRIASTPADTRLGGGIFLHVSNGRSTAGCVSIPMRHMRSLLTWLDPAKAPVIVIGTASGLLAVH